MSDWLSDADECFEKEDEADADRGDDQQRERCGVHQVFPCRQQETSPSASQHIRRPYGHSSSYTDGNKHLHVMHTL